MTALPKQTSLSFDLPNKRHEQRKVDNFFYFIGLGHFQTGPGNSKSNWHILCVIAIENNITARHFPV
ncbi:hypothetical protein [Methylicorpusculum sp.]|uniref:hypothetical protein n=1 Tax=Methylicorpusculum sp. TaxID=2713644 RepID=UPI0027304FFD|nr:hypothetical protein [Methylicorpusculum sp.]